jgi:hypothetical protein
MVTQPAPGRALAERIATCTLGEDRHGRSKAIEIARRLGSRPTSPRSASPDAERAQEQLARVTLAIRRLGRKAKVRRRQFEAGARLAKASPAYLEQRHRCSRQRPELGAKRKWSLHSATSHFDHLRHRQLLNPVVAPVLK